MTLFQIYTRLGHFFTALHWRGYAVHSPMMYRFVREVVLSSTRKTLPLRITSRYPEHSVATFESVEQFVNSIGDSAIEVAMIRQPYLSRAEKDLMHSWYAENHAVVAHFQGLLVLFLDAKLQKQFYKIRN